MEVVFHLSLASQEAYRAVAAGVHRIMRVLVLEFAILLLITVVDVNLRQTKVLQVVLIDPFAQCAATKDNEGDSRITEDVYDGLIIVPQDGIDPFQELEVVWALHAEQDTGTLVRNNAQSGHDLSDDLFRSDLNLAPVLFAQRDMSNSLHRQQ